MMTEQRRLVWRFIGTAAAIVVTIGVALVVARWTGPLG
jgi:hypothetical protein